MFGLFLVLFFLVAMQEPSKPEPPVEIPKPSELLKKAKSQAALPPVSTSFSSEGPPPPPPAFAAAAAEPNPALDFLNDILPSIAVEPAAAPAAAAAAVHVDFFAPPQPLLALGSAVDASPLQDDGDSDFGDSTEGEKDKGQETAAKVVDDDDSF